MYVLTVYHGIQGKTLSPTVKPTEQLEAGDRYSERSRRRYNDGKGLQLRRSNQVSEVVLFSPLDDQPSNRSKKALLTILASGTSNLG